MTTTPTAGCWTARRTPAGSTPCAAGPAAAWSPPAGRSPPDRSGERVQDGVAVVLAGQAQPVDRRVHAGRLRVVTARRPVLHHQHVPDAQLVQVVDAGLVREGLDDVAGVRLVGRVEPAVAVDHLLE